MLVTVGKLTKIIVQLKWMNLCYVLIISIELFEIPDSILWENYIWKAVKENQS